MSILIRSRLFVVLLIVAAAGCAPASHLTHPEFDAREASLHTIRLIEPDVKMFEVQVGGRLELMDEWTEAARANVDRLLAEGFAQRKLVAPARIEADDLSPEEQENLRVTQAQFKAINMSLLRHQFGEKKERFSEQKEAFAHTLGREVRTLDPSADAYLFIWGEDFKSSGGRKAAQVGGFVVGALLGVAVVPVPVPTGLSAAIVDADDGTILWYSNVKRDTGIDLRSENSVRRMMDRLLRDLPLGATTATAAR